MYHQCEESMQSGQAGYGQGSMQESAVMPNLLNTKDLVIFSTPQQV